MKLTANGMTGPIMDHVIQLVESDGKVVKGRKRLLKDLEENVMVKICVMEIVLPRFLWTALVPVLVFKDTKIKIINPH